MIPRFFARAPRRMGFTEIEKDRERSRFEEEGKKSFWTYLRCLSDTQLEKYMSLKVRGEVRPGNINLGGVSVLVEFKTPDLDEIERVV